MLTLPIPKGEHLIRLENNGRDWVHLREFTLSPYAPELAVLGKGSSDYAVLWVYRREPSPEAIEGVLSVPSVAPGTYRISFFDTQSGVTVRSEVIRFSESPIRFATGPVEQDVAIWVTPTSDSPTTQPAR